MILCLTGLKRSFRATLFLVTQLINIFDKKSKNAKSKAVLWKSHVLNPILFQITTA